MTKPWLLVALWFVLPAWAQAPDEEAERARIAAERGRIEAAYEKAQRDCYRKFAVNDCLEEAKGRRRESLAELRRQEITLDDARRRRDAAERIRELDERRDTRARERDEARARAQADERERRQRAASKAADAQRNQQQARERAERAVGAREEAPQPDTADKLRRHRDRVTEAQEHKAKVQQRAAQEGPPAKSLPLPP